MGFPPGYSSPRDASDSEAATTTAATVRAKAWVEGYCLRGWHRLGALATLFIAAATAAMAATDFSDYSAFSSASSTTVSTIRIGATTDSETSVISNASATGDDNNVSDDEDGVTLPASLVAGTTGSFTVNVTNTSGATVYLNAWIDYNKNGLLTDTGEQVATNTTIATGTSNANRTISFTVPAGATIGTVGVRVRLTSTGSPGPTGLSGNGEVEDNLVQICPAITVSPTSLASASVGTAYSQTLSSGGGTSPYSYSVSSGTLPSGLALSAAGALTGTPTSSDSQTFTVQATDASGCVGSRSYTLAPACTSYVISPFAMGSWELSAAVNISLIATATSGTANGPYTWTKTSGTLPTGLSLSSAGVLSGTTTAKGTYSFTIQVSDSYGCTGTQSYLMTVASGSSYSSLLYVTSGSGSTGYLETYDVSSKVKTLVGQTRDSTAHYLTDLAWSPSGILYGIDFNNIYQINPSTGALTRLGSFSSTNSFNGLVFDAGGKPYISSVNDGDIYTFSTSALSTSSSTALTLAFSSPSTAPNGEALDSAGDLAWIGNELYYTTAGSGFTSFYLYKVPAGGTTTQLVGQIKNSSGTSIADVFGLSTDGYGTLYAQAGTALYTLDKTTGVATTVNSSIASNAITGGAMRYEFTQVLDDFGDYSLFPVARDTVYSSLRLGALTDYDIPAAFNTTANADDLAWTDDEDGVTLPASVVQGATGASVTVKVTNTSGAPAFLNGWIDFGNNGSLTDSGDQIINNVTIPTGTSNVSQTYTFNVPANCAVGSLGARFRITAVSNPGSSGASGPGEVEDYLVNVTCSTITVNPATPAAPTVGTPYSQTISATGGNAPYTFAIATGSLPAGLTLNSTTGVISGTVTSSSAASFTLRATDSKGCTGTRAITLTPLCPTVTVAPPTLNTPTVGSSFTQTLSATGGLSPYTWALTSGTLPAGLSLSASNGILSGIATSPTAASFTARATDAAGCLNTQFYTVTPVCPTIDISPDTLTPGSVGTAYSQTLTAAGGTAPYSAWTVISGTLPAGLSLNASTGVISGTPTASASPATTVTVRVTDTYGCQATQDVTLQICPVISITPGILPTPTVGTAYSQTLSASGGAAAYTFTLAGGSLPAWATLSSAGVISGTPNSTATASFTVRATDANGCSSTLALTLTPVCPAVTITPTALTTGTVGSAYSQALSASGGIAPYSAWTITSGTLAAGLTLNASTGVISGTPTAAASPATSVTVRVNDANGCQGSRAITLQVCPVITFSPTTLPTPTVGTAYSQTLTAAGGGGSYVYSLASGTLPTWASLTSAGVLSGTPNTTATAIFTVRVTDANGCAATLACTVTPQCPTITINPAALPAGSVGTAYSQTLAASGGIAPYGTWTVTGGALPAGLTLNASTGVISGTPTASASPATTITVRVNDANGCQGTRAITLQICPAIALSPTTPATGTVGSAYSQTITATGGAASYTYAVVSGSLPAGLSLHTATGVVSGTPTAQTSGNVTIRATDANGCQGSRAMTFAMGCPAITISTASLPDGTVGTAYSQALAASGGSSTYTWSVTSGTLPAGLSLSSGGVLSGTPTTSNGSGVSVTIAATDAANSCAATKTYTLQVCPVVALAPATLATATVGSAYSQTITASGGAASYTYTLASGTLPTWATLSSAGVLSGTPSDITAATFTIRATDANGCEGTRTYTLTPVCSTISISPTSLAQGTVGTAYSQTLAASGGTAPYGSWTVISGTLPAGLTLGASTGVISGTPTAAASPATSVMVRVSDANGCQSSQTVTLQVCPVIALAPGSLTAPVVGTAYSQTLSASGGASAYTYSLVSGTLPAWATLSSGGVLSGTPNSTTPATFTVRAADANGCVKTLAYTLAPVCPSLSITPATLAQGVVGTAYSQTLAASGGTTPYTWAVTSGTLPTGLALNTSTGVISGTPSAVNATGASVTVRATDANGCQASSLLTVQVCPAISVTPTTLTAGTVGVSYSRSLASSGGTAPYTYTLASGTLPAGLSLSSAGVVSGKPTTANGLGGSFTVRSTDANGCVKNQSVSLKICPVITLPGITGTWTVGTASSQTITPTGGTAPYVMALVSGTLPAGVTFNTSTGVLSGTPTSAASSTFVLSGTDANGCVGSRSYTLAPQCPVISVGPGTLAVGMVGASYSQSFITAGGSAAYSYAITGGTLPDGLSFNTSTGAISGTPTTAGTSAITVTVTDATGCQTTISRSITISSTAVSNCPTPFNQSIGGAYLVTRLGRDVMGGENSGLGNCLYNMSPNGRWITGIRTGLKSYGFILNTLTDANVAVPLLDSAHPYAMGRDVNDSGNAVGYEKWTSGAKVNIIPWYYSQSTGTSVRLLTPYDANASVSAMPCALTSDSAYAFGTVDPDGPGGPVLSQGGFWNLSTRAWTAISGVREVIDASADGTKLLVTDSSGVGKVISGSPAGGYSTTVISFTGGSLNAGRVSPNGRYIGSSQRLSGVPVPFVYDTQTSTRTNLPRILPKDNLGGIVGAISDTGRVLGSMYSTAATGSFAVMWDTPADLYTRISDLLVSDGHVEQDSAYSFWNIYNGGDGISADGTTLGVYGNNPYNVEDSMLFQRVAVADTRLCLGNAVWQDTNRDGIKDYDEPGAEGAVVHLFHPGADGVRGGTGVNADYEVAAPVTITSSGAYVFSDIPSGVYYVKVDPPAALPVTSGVVVAVDNGVDNDNNGMQPGGPGTPLYSPLITLIPGTESVNDGDNSNDTEFTIDFGLGDGVSVGDLVFADTNGDGLYQSATESGVPNITVQLLDGSTGNVLLSTDTDDNGNYFFGGQAPGTYRINIPTPPAAYTSATLTVYADNGVNNDSNGIQNGGSGTATVSPLFTLATGTEPGASGSTSYENTLDFGFRSCPVISVTPTSFSGGLVGTAFSQVLNASGSSATPYTWSTSSGTWPAGLSLSSSGSISGTPTVPTSGVSGQSVTVRVMDASTCFRDLPLQVKVCPVIALNPTTLPAPVIGAPYAQTITTSGTSATPVVFSATGLPAWLYLDATTGVLSGTPTNSTAVTFTVIATDANLCSASRSYTLPPVCPTVTISPAVPPVGKVGVAYSQALTATPTSGLTGQYYSGSDFKTLLLTRQDPTINFNWGAGSPDPLVPLDRFSVRWSGFVRPTTTGTYTFQVTSDDGVRVWVNNSLVIDKWLDQSATNYTATVTLTAGNVVPVRVEYFEGGGDAVIKLYWSGPGFTLQPVANWLEYAWGVSGGTLPAGLTLNATSGVISGTPTAANGIGVNLTITATDPNGCSGSRVWPLQICPVITLTPSSLPPATVGQLYTQTIAAAGGTAPYQYAVVSGTLPAWCSFNTSTGKLSGTPTDNTPATFTVSATDANGCVSTQVYTLDPRCSIFTATPATLPTATVGVAYSQALTTSGGAAPYTYVLSSGTLPAGFTLSTDGIISGTGTTGDGSSASITVGITDSTGCVGSASYQFKVCPAITLNPTTLPTPTIGYSYSQTISASGTTATPLTWSASGLPAWLSISSSTGVLSGTPTSLTPATFTLIGTDAKGCVGSRSYTVTPVCPVITVGGTTPPNGYLSTSFSQNITATGGTAPYSFAKISGTLPPGLSMATDGSVTGVPTTLGSYTITVRATDAYNCQSATTSVTYNIKAMGIGNQVWVDMNDDGLRGSTESGVPNLPMQLWSPGPNGAMNNGGSDDVLVASTTTDSNGLYLFTNLAPGIYYVRIPTPPTYYPRACTSQVTLDNGVNNDNNGIQSASGDPVVTPLITLSPAAEPGTGVDGDDTDADSTIDIGFANGNPCQITNLLDNPSFEFQGLPNTTGTATTVLGYDGTGTSFGSGINAFQWLGGTNGTSGVGEPVQRVQVNAGTTGSKVSWVESVKSRHGKRMLLLQGTNSAVNLLPAGGGAWSSVLQAGKEYELSVWATSASSGAASILWNLGANAQIFQIITGATPGIYQYYTVPQGDMSATAAGVSQCCGYSGGTISYPAFGATDYNNWTEAGANSTQPQWRQFTYHFRIVNGATAAQIDTATLALSGGSSTNAVAADLVYLCQVSTTATLTIGNLIWNDANKNGLRDTGELGVSSVVVDLFRSTNDTAGDADDLLIGSTTTSATGAYNFTGLADGKYVVRVTPPASIPATGGNVVTLDNGVNNDNNGSQPGGPGTYLYSPVITLGIGAEPVNDGDTNPDTELSIDFGLFTGIQLGNQLFIDANNDGAYSSGTETGVGAGVTVELLDGTVNTVIASTTTNSSGVYGFTVYQPATYRVRVPTPPSLYPLASGVVSTTDDGRDNDSNGIQTGGINTAAISPVITLTAGGEPGSTGNSNVENTIDFGFRACPAISISPGTVAVATQYVAYNPLTLTSSGGSGGYVYAISSGALPSGMSMSSAGVISGTPGASAAPGSYTFSVRSTDSQGCAGTQSYTLTLFNAVVTVNPATLPAATQYAAYTQNLAASGGTSPYTWSYGPAALSGAAVWWPGENGAAEVIAGNGGSLMNGVAFTTGIAGRAFSFDGVNDYMQVADQSVMRPAQITLEAWVRPASSTPTADQIIIEKTADVTAPTNGYGLIQKSGTSSVRFWINRPSTAAGTSDYVDAPVTVNAWNHVAATYDGANLKIYVNGVQVASKAFTVAISHATQPLVVGGSATAGTNWSGALDEPVIYNRAITAAEALARYTITNSGNNGMPTGITLDATTGVLSGTPTAVPASYPFTVRASDLYSGVGLRSYSLTVGCPTLNITPKTLADAPQYAAYAATTLTATGGTAPYLWDITSGALPTGMSLSTAGVISGTPGSAPATYSFTVRARDANNCVSTQALSVKVICPTITLTPATLPNAQQYAAYSAVLLDGTGGSSPYTFSIQSGALPTGMSLSSAGLLSGTPTAVPGDYTVVIKGTDSASCSGTRSYTLKVTCPTIAVSPSSLPNGRQYQAYSQTLTASGGNPAYSWSIASGALPTGLSLSTAGVISGTPTAVPGTYTFRALVTDSVGCTGTRDCSILFDCPVISITPTTLPQATTTVVYSQQLTASGGSTPYTWTLASGALPAGITFSSGGLISGTTTAVGSFNFTVQASDLNGCVKQQALSLGVNCAAITITPASLPTATVGTAYSQQLSSTGGVGTKTWSLKTGALPTGMSISSSGLISGTPTSSAGSYNVTIQAMDQNNCPGTISYVLTLQCPTISITPTTAPAGIVATSYSASLSATGGTAPYTWSIPTGSAPTGLALNPAGTLSGTPTAPGSYSFTAQARDTYGCTASATISVTVTCPTLALSPTSLPSGYRGVAYSQTVTSSGGISPYTYSITAGSLPPGVTLNTSTGVISGTPTATGSYSFTLRGLDSATCSGTRDYILVVNGLSLGNLVWEDLDQSGTRDVGRAGHQRRFTAIVCHHRHGHRQR